MANIGKAENSASITVTSGTSAISVVKVRLLAVMPRRSSRKRWRSVRAVSNQGQSRSVCTSARNLVGASVPQAVAHRHAGYDASMTEARTPDAALGMDAIVRWSRWLALGSLLGLIVLGLAWELWLAPTGRGTLAIKVLPLLIPLPGLWRARMYTYRWVSLLVWIYFAEGVVRATTDKGLSAVLAGIEVLLCLLLFVACALHVRWRLHRASRAATA